MMSGFRHPDIKPVLEKDVQLGPKPHIEIQNLFYVSSHPCEVLNMMFRY